jgi:predicted AAA+ superfamily ATPase
MVLPDPTPRSYTAILRQHFAEHRQMALLAGPRQVGKTTVCRGLDADASYLNWDDQDDRALFLRGPKAVAAELQLDRLRDDRPLVVFDEIHKHGKWKQFLKGCVGIAREPASAVPDTCAALLSIARSHDVGILGIRYEPEGTP